ncbi:lipid II:glycine glycyltransferase FemX [Acetobacteroides hydrogenigenes]|uniref:Lipid II:glycine glycyltransferase (Peptidoglycan interpeptide bridge formation enzyme) n=1 Tax=Acetobacteroides hydrogenigenes TaxID=979970 RepID=A0A4R2ET05_9BACT|nr:peptidoglycan bridge formation glycyltransferase FemA/FemB family protein [Acetobacteroides hydrogenigenes]TCN67649.1 lipid II:glycine glycyltransferase (peptidoglycan interpeptide bridge formation enzyme) [Acetobacteroides hydrogenigenes]
MLTDIHSKETDQLFKTSIVQQTAFWSVVKTMLGVETIALNFKINRLNLNNIAVEERIVESDLLVIVQHLDRNHSIAYVPYGPELEPQEDLQGQFLEELSECLRTYIPSNCIMIRYDLCWESYWAKDTSYFDENGHWAGPPENPIQELRFNMNTVGWKFKKSFSNILPSNTIYLDLKNDLTTMLEQMKPKTRYNIGLSERKGVSVRSVGIEHINIWYQLYQETAARNGIYLHDIEYFKAVLSAKTNNMQSPADVILLIAEAEGAPLAAMFLVITGSRGSYLYGASSSTGRNAMATYALQWSAINIARERGCTEYDMFGVAPRPEPSHPLYGLYRFKTGFGGEIYHSLGCWDYPLDSQKYAYYSSLELKEQGYHMN